jgi:hypothetical protein
MWQTATATLRDNAMNEDNNKQPRSFPHRRVIDMLAFVRFMI